ncbi:MAG: hypothetical protein NVSMB17_02270 [Candidatus Dormibacteria bacterium]
MLRMNQRRLHLAVVALALIAVIGEITIIQSTIAALVRAGAPGERATMAGDFLPLLGAARAFIHGQSAAAWYGNKLGPVYAPPYVVLLGPLGLLPASVATAIARLVALGCEAAALALWVSESKQRREIAVILLLTLPAIQVVMNGQLMAGSGVLALTFAIWSQRRNRWLWAGAALALGFIRISNALPVAATLIMVASARRRDLAHLSGGFALILAPLSAIAFVWDWHWPADYLYNLHELRLSGPLHLVQLSYGLIGIAALTAINCVACAYIARRDRGRPIDLDRGAAVLALSVLTATLTGTYTAVFALPALVRMAARPGMSLLPFVMAFGGWVAVLVWSPFLLGSDPLTAINYVDTIVPLVLVGAAYPLLMAVRGQPAATAAAAGT